MRRREEERKKAVVLEDKLKIVPIHRQCDCLGRHSKRIHFKILLEQTRLAKSIEPKNTKSIIF